MSSQSEFLPTGDLERFILVDVVRPHIESLLDDGVSIQVNAVFVAGRQRKDAGVIGLAKRGLQLNAEIRCKKNIQGSVQVQGCCRPRDIDDMSKIGAVWDLSASIRSDERGLYCQSWDIDIPEIDMGEQAVPPKSDRAGG